MASCDFLGVGVLVTCERQQTIAAVQYIPGTTGISFGCLVFEIGPLSFTTFRSYRMYDIYVHVSRRRESKPRRCVQSPAVAYGGTCTAQQCDVMPSYLYT